jgi:hypothetical protein
MEGGNNVKGLVRYHCGGRPKEVNSCVLNSYMDQINPLASCFSLFPFTLIRTLFTYLEPSLL